MTTPNVLVTGMGAVTPIGDSVEEFWESNLAGRSGLVREDRMDLDRLPCGWTVGRIPARTKQRVTERWARPHRGWHEILMHDVVDQALRDAGLAEEDPAARPADAGPIGLFWCKVGAGPGGPVPEEFPRWWSQLAERHRAVGSDRGPIYDYLQRHGERPEGDITAFPQEVAQRLGRPLVGAKMDATCSGGLRAVVEATRALRAGRIGCAIVAAVTSRATPYVMSQYAQLMALSRWSGPPEQASMPFDRRRTGMVINESAGALILETEEHARDRGVTSEHAAVAGWGLAIDASHVTRPRAEMVERVITTALDGAGLGPADVDVVNAHATSTKMNDLMEGRAIRSVFGRHLDGIDVCAVKSITGHGSATSGVTESAVAALSLCRGVVPPVVTCTEPDPECGITPSLEPTVRPVDVVVKNSFGFGGQYASVVYRRPPRPRTA